MKFKIGDLLRFKNDGSCTAQTGATAICRGYDCNHYVIVNWIRNELSGCQCNGGYYECDFELVEKKVKNIKVYGIVTFLKSIEKTNE